MNTNRFESLLIYQVLCYSNSMNKKYLRLKCETISECLHNAHSVFFLNTFGIISGSRAEGTDITSGDYGKLLHSKSPSYISDGDIMDVWCNVCVIDEGDTLPQRFDKYIYLQAERGEHTTDGFRKLRIIHDPVKNSRRIYKGMPLLGERAPHINPFNLTVKHGYMSSLKFLATALSLALDEPSFLPKGTRLATQGPSLPLEQCGSYRDFVKCFYVNTWPKEAESWFTRQAHWADRKLKRKIRKIGYLLVPTGNSNSHESDLEWRCSFSIAEKMLFQSMTTFQRCTFVMLKVLLKEYLPSDINTVREKQLLSSYHIKTLFLWSLEDSRVKWDPQDMLDNIGYMLGKLLRWINHQYIPHYFIPSVNLLDIRRLHGRQTSLTLCISAIRKDLSNKFRQSQFYMGQTINPNFCSKDKLNDLTFFMYIHYYVMKCITGTLQWLMHSKAFDKIQLSDLKYNHSVLIEGLINMKMDINPQVKHLFRAMYSDPVHDILLTEVVPRVINQYRGCILLAKYCMAARDGRVQLDTLHTAESLLNDTLHLDPCSGYVKLACLYMATGDFVQAMDRVHAAEKNFLFIQQNMMTGALRNVQLNRIEVNKEGTEVYTVLTGEIFQKWVDGQVTSNIFVTWPEYITAPDLLQFELIHESTQHVTDVQYQSNVVAVDCFLQFPPLSLIKLLKFVCTFYSSTIPIENLVAELISSSLSVGVLPDNDIYTVFNMAAWCYLKIKKYKPATRMVMVAIGSCSETDIMKRCAFSHHFVAYIIEQCLVKGSRVLVYKRDTLAS